MPNLNVRFFMAAALGLTPAVAADVVCGFMDICENGDCAVYIDDPNLYNGPSTTHEDFYECDDSSLMNYAGYGDKVCITYSTISQKSSNAYGSTYHLTGCKYSHALCPNETYVVSPGCYPCPSGRSAMGYIEKKQTFKDGLTNLYYHAETACNYCTEDNQYLSGGTCVTCPTSDLGTVFAHGTGGITSCSVSLGNNTTTVGRDASGTYELTIQADGSEMIYDDYGRMDILYYCKYRQ